MKGTFEFDEPYKQAERKMLVTWEDFKLVKLSLLDCGNVQKSNPL